MFEFWKISLKSYARFEVIINTTKRVNQMPYIINPTILKKGNDLVSYSKTLFYHNMCTFYFLFSYFITQIKC